jgi:lambda repressor-like predicted transcriptional regulator
MKVKGKVGDKIIKLYLKGLTLRQVGRKVGVCYETIRKYLIKNNIPRRKQGVISPDPDAKTINKIVKMYKSGTNIFQIKKKIGISYRKVKNILLNKGVKLRPAR